MTTPNRTPHPRPLRPRGAARVIPEHAVGRGTDEVVQHPDGWYWTMPGGRRQFGPFDTASAAQADRDRAVDEEPLDGDALRAAEVESGIADWIDAEAIAGIGDDDPPSFEER